LPDSVGLRGVEVSSEGLKEDRVDLRLDREISSLTLGSGGADESGHVLAEGSFCELLVDVGDHGVEVGSCKVFGDLNDVELLDERLGSVLDGRKEVVI